MKLYFTLFVSALLTLNAAATDHEIKVKYKNGKLTYQHSPHARSQPGDGDKLYVRVGDKIRWFNEDGEHVYVFKKGTPCKEGFAFIGKKGEYTETCTVQDPKTGKKKFKYAVFVGKNPQRPTPDDPEIIIGEF